MATSKSKKKAKSKKKTTRKTRKATKKRAPKKTVSRKRKPDTLFTVDFRNFLTTPPPAQGGTWNWPPTGQVMKVSLSEYAAVVTMLCTAYGNNAPPPPVKDGTFVGNATDRVSAYGWPTNFGYATKSPEKDPVGVHLVEIDLISDMLLTAINDGSGGGTKGPPIN